MLFLPSYKLYFSINSHNFSNYPLIIMDYSIPLIWHASCITISMLIAITIWNGRIAPLFDSAGCALLIDADLPESGRCRIALPKGSVNRKVSFLKEHGVSLLICGAISNEGKAAVIDAKIGLYPFIAGSVPDVVNALNEHTCMSERFAMPGCRCRRRRCGQKERGNECSVISSDVQTVNKGE